MSASFEKMATVTASTKRSPTLDADGLRGRPEAHLTGLKVLPLDPVEANIQVRLELDTPFEMLQTMVEGGPDIKEGDTLVVSGTEYVIRAVEDWTWRPAGTDTLLLILEELKTEGR